MDELTTTQRSQCSAASGGYFVPKLSTLSRDLWLLHGRLTLLDRPYPFLDEVSGKNHRPFVNYQLTGFNFPFRHVGRLVLTWSQILAKSCLTCNRIIAHLHLKTQADYAERNDGERVMTTHTTPMRHSPAFDIVAKARGRRSDCSAGLVRGLQVRT
jgi:hypothetical protein